MLPASQVRRTRRKRAAHLRTTQRSDTEETTGAAPETAIHVIGVLRDGRSLSARELRPGDGSAALLVMKNLSPRSNYLRYFGQCPSAGDREIARIVSVDADRLSIVGLVGDTPVALAEIDGLNTSQDSEIAFAVDDAFQRLGVGTLLLAELARHAAALGITTLIADVLPENRLMIEVFERSGFQTSLTVSQGVERVLLSLNPESVQRARALRSEREQHRAPRPLPS
jgi:GNAT superfamily N-acetyltransferase